MLSIGKLGAGRADYYLAQVHAGADEYYTAGGAPPGRWTGAGAEALGMAGPVDAAAFRALLDGTHPATGQALGGPARAGRVAGFDLCLSAPKSVSVAWALADPAVAEVIASGHRRAVDAAMAAMEAEAVGGRRGRDGARQVDTAAMAAACFDHVTSRAGDPQLHTHVVVANLTVDGDGRWSALDGTRLYRWAKTIGYAYHAHLRAELTTTLGATWSDVTKGAAELEAVPAGLARAFSTRAAQIATTLDDWGAASRPAARAAGLATRAPKHPDATLDVLRAGWADHAGRSGLAVAPLGPAGRVADAPDHDELAGRLLGPDGLTANTSAFDRRAVIQAVAAAHPAGLAVPALRAEADRVLADPRVVPLAARGPAGRMFSTGELLAVEAAVLDSAARRRPAGTSPVPTHIVDTVLAARPSLTGEQAAMVAHLAASAAGVRVVVGRAGTGKTYALDAARAAWEAAGHPVVGAALAARAAAELQAGAGIASSTVDRLLAELDRPGPFSGLAPGAVVVVDEAGMVGTRTLARLAAHAERANATLVLVGDPRQLPEIAAGGAFAALARRGDAVELSANRRQDQPWERDALDRLRSGDVAAAVTAYHHNGRVTLADSADTARARLVADWWDAHRGGQRAAMYALRRSDVDDLNARGRALAETAGLLGADRLDAAGRQFAVGDLVVCGRNDRRLGVINGMAGRVAAVDVDGRTVTLAGGAVLPGWYLDGGHLAHGYATTIHKAQGATVDRAFLLGSDQLYREAGYVGLSRARARTDLYLVTGGPEQARDRDPLHVLAATLTASGAKTLAGAAGPDPDAMSRAAWAALVADPPAWASAALGPPPANRLDRDRWADTATRIAAWRHHTDGLDPAEPLGPPPADPDRRDAWETARLALTIHQHRTHDRHLEQGLSR